MKKIALLLSIAMLALILPGCGSSKTKLYVYNWGEYIDESVISDFEAKYPDIKVIYETFETNEDMYTKIKPGDDCYDVLIPSDYMIGRLIDEDMLEKLNFENIPNYSYIDDKYKAWDYDPTNEYSVPYMWGVLGILYDTTKVQEDTFTWNTLFDPKYKNQVLMKDDSRDTLGIALKSLGYSMNSTDENELKEAENKLLEHKDNYFGIVGDEGMDMMVEGDAPLAVMYSGDAARCISENENLAFAIPEDGTNYFVDAMVIPKNAKHKKEAELFINFMCETDTALKNVEEINYSTPHTGAYEQLDAERRNSFQYPGEDVLKAADVYNYLGSKEKLRSEIWNDYTASIAE
ncbi:MAG: ABC transporter substrate-binding protein [Clostridia bacterium]|nr:ABC transporter substrate-binding protein [Clostridia bacterium]